MSTDISVSNKYFVLFLIVYNTIFLYYYVDFRYSKSSDTFPGMFDVILCMLVHVAACNGNRESIQVRVPYLQVCRIQVISAHLLLGFYPPDFIS